MPPPPHLEPRHPTASIIRIRSAARAEQDAAACRATSSSPEKSSQARDVRAALGNRYGSILPAEGHLITLCEPEEVNPDWKRWMPLLLRPERLFGTKPATGGNKASKLKAIKEALRSPRRVWLATDCDRERQLIGPSDRWADRRLLTL